MLDPAVVLFLQLDTESLVHLSRTLSGGSWLGEVRTALLHRSAFDHRVEVVNWRVEFSPTPRAPYTV